MGLLCGFSCYECQKFCLRVSRQSVKMVSSCENDHIDIAWVDFGCHKAPINQLFNIYGQLA